MMSAAANAPLADAVRYVLPMAGRRLFVISDLHLGGRPPGGGKLGFQLCQAYRELVEFVDWVRTQDGRAGETRELIINGDVIDFLADDDYAGGVTTSAWTPDDAAAVAKLEHVVAQVRVDGRGVFDALADFVRDGHQLTLLLGNHDVELSLPAVRRRLETLLGPGRLRLIYDGEAYAVGRVLIEHGNRYDAWNILDFDRLREERSVRSRGLPIDDAKRRDRYFRPPSGTLLVTHFMNPLKHRYRFIDLLKPETGAVLPLLLALEPDLDLGLRALLRVAPIVRGMARRHHDASGMPVQAGELGGVDSGEGRRLTLDDVLDDVLGADATLFANPAAEQVGDLGGVDELWSALSGMAEKLRTLGANLYGLAAIKLARNDDVRRKRLIAALTATATGDRTFDVHHEIDDYRIPATTLCKTGAFDVVVFGHTHVPKQVDLDNAVGRRARYLNTGTWASVIRLDELPRPIEDSFIDAVIANQLDSYTRRYLTYAEIVLDGDTARDAVIRSFCGRARPREAPLVDARLARDPASLVDAP